MKALPKTRYVTVAAETWGLIRGAYLSGLSAPTVAARFGVSVTALRKHAAKEGWTKRAFAARQALERSAPPSGPAPAAPADGPPDEAAVQPHRHHLRAAAAAFLVEAVEAVLQVLEEVLAGVEALRRGKAHVVGVEGVGNDEVLAAIRLLQEVGQVVRIVIR